MGTFKPQLDKGYTDNLTKWLCISNLCPVLSGLQVFK